MRELRQWLADGLVRAAADRMRQRHPDWAEAMMSEHNALSGRTDQLGWAFGSLQASLTPKDALYPAALALAVSTMAFYQWSADESLVTVSVLTALALVLGLVRPSRFLVSGIVLGIVVCAVNAFETISGFRPAYELHRHSWSDDLRWLVLLLPALLSSAVGRQVGRSLLAR